MGDLRKAAYLIVAIIVFLFSLGAVDFWIFRFWEGSVALYNYWIAVGLVFISFGACLSVIMYISNPKISSKTLLGIFVTPFILFVAGIWDWVIYFIYLHYNVAYPPYSNWSAQSRWAKPFGIEWTAELQLLWTFVFVILLIFMWMKILGKKVKFF